MAQRRSNHRTASLPDTTIIARRKLQARRATNARRRVLSLAEPYVGSEHLHHASASPSPTSSRPVLVPLHFNLRRLPSRILSGRKESMRESGNAYDVSIGMKRKRVVSGSENTSGSRGARSASRAKRRKAMPDSSDEDHASGMDVDEQDRWDHSDNSEEDGGLDSSDSYLINEAPPRRLLRLRKDELVRLYAAAGLTEDAELLTKPEIVDCLVAARDDVADLPPSSPGVGDSGSSDYSSDGGNVAGGEETDFGNRLKNGLRRRATLHDLGRASRRHVQDRCLSMSHIQHAVGDFSPSHGKRTRGSGDFRAAQQPNGVLTRSNASSSRSSPTSSVPSHALPSPPATRLRTRKASGDVDPGPSSSSAGKGKGKGKHVGFSDAVEVSRLPSPEQEESDLTDLTEVESSLSQLKPSPRRLRSKGSVSKLGREKRRSDEVPEANRRVTPMRKAKGRVGNLHESTDEEGNEEDELLSSDPEGDEVDQLDDSPSPMATPKAKPTPRGRHTPVRSRLRTRHLQTHTPPSDGDDEDSEEEGTIVAGEEGDDEESIDDEETVHAEPRVLRNGKVVGEGDVEEDDGEEVEEDVEDEEVEEDVEDDGAEDSESIGSTADDISVDEENEDVEEPMEDDVDLTVATAKTLVRLRRDDLVRLCETRDIEASGTKPQLAEALLQWRDRHCSEATTSAPSSTGTARPPSTVRAPRRRKTRSKSGSGGRGSTTPPVLLRTHHVHMDEPRTPPLSGRQREKDGEGELELDLESLGLEDREIPPEKLTKLEKIGSGGFKDVFIGKFKGRRVAIAEFRGQLSAMDIKELKLLGDFDHPNIVRFLGVSIPENTRETPVMIVSELCSNGDLFDYVRNVHPPSLYRALCIMLDIARGLEYLHLRKPSVIHRDCKSSNILITSRGVAKITDFGLAKVKESTRSMVRSVVGTVNWQAPELWHPHPKYNHKVDVFSCAMVYWEILQWHVPNKKYPWEGMNEHAIYEAVGAKKLRPSVSGLRKQWCPEIVDLVERMWQQDPQDRPTMSEVVQELERLVKMYR